MNRPTKKQKILLDFIAQFIAQHGYGPSYREIMSGLGYKSVATVALHIDNLIARGHLRKKTHSARSLEVIDGSVQAKSIPTTNIKPDEEKWLVDKIDYRFHLIEQSGSISQTDLDSLYVLAGALKVLGLEGAATGFIARISELKKRVN